MILIACCLIAIPGPKSSTPVLVPGPTVPHVVPPRGDAPSREPQFYIFSWQEFFALNWPAKVTAGTPERGVADSTKTLADLAVPRVWETWDTGYEVVPAHA